MLMTKNFSNCQFTLPKFSILVGVYGDYYHYASRVLSSIVDESEDANRFKTHMALSACSSATIRLIRQAFDEEKIDSLHEMSANVNKDSMMRLLIDCVDTDYFLWLDDDSYLLSGWRNAILDFVCKNHPFDGAGHVHFSNRSKDYLNFLRQRPWFQYEPRTAEVWFPTGGLFFARTAFVRRNNFPDKGMVKRQDDLLFGDCIDQCGGRLVDFGRIPEIMNRIRISCGQRRGTGEGGMGEGWLPVDPITGE